MRHAVRCTAAAPQCRAVEPPCRCRHAAAAVPHAAASARAVALRLPAPPCTRTARRRRACAARAASAGGRPDADLLAALNDVSNRAVRAMLANDASALASLRAELADTAAALRDVAGGAARSDAGDDSDEDESALHFLAALGELLDHRVLPGADALGGAYARALGAVLAAVEVDWRLSVPGQPDGPVPEPRYSTWQEVMDKKKQRDKPPPPPAASRAPADLYAVLGVPRGATKAEIKAAYRAKAREMHPDVVGSGAGADAAFAAVIAAYTALTDDSRGSTGGVVDSWDEFKRTPKKQSARSTARGRGPAADAASDEPQAGDLVEYPLPAHALDAAGERTAGVGLLVSRNRDRGDARTLPPELLDVCEVEPLRQREPDGAVWVPDELAGAVFPKMPQLRVIDRAAVTYESAHDFWTITATLSPGCAGPPHEEEVML